MSIAGVHVLQRDNKLIVQINRDLAIPIYTQIVGQLQFDIVSGRLPPGTQLASIRELAQELAVAPMTITQAYQELRQLGLIDTRPGLGTFVTDAAVSHVNGVIPNRQMELRRILQRMITDAHRQGFSQEEIKQGFIALLSTANGLFASRHVVLLGLFAAALRAYADDLERNLAEERISVDPITFDDLAARPDLYQPRLDQAEALLVPIHQVQTAHDLLQGSALAWSGPILGLNFVLRPAVAQAIARLPSAASIGIVSRFPEFVNTMIQGIASVHPLEVEPTICLSTDTACLQQMCQQVQAIIYASGADAAMTELSPLIPATVPCIEYLHTPDALTYQRIRQWLTVGASAPAASSEIL